MRKYLKNIWLWGLLVTFVGAVVAGQAMIYAKAGGPAWAAPSAMAVKRISDVPDGRHEPVLFSNLSCTTITYRLAGDHQMRKGCFTPAAFGLVDTDSEVVIFNGTDEGLPVSVGPWQVVAPWPKALNLLKFSGSATGGSYLNMYDNPLAAMRDERDQLGRLVGKQLVAPPDHKLRDVDNRPLIVHPQATAFSDNGSWMVVETIYGYFARVNLASLKVVPFAPALNSIGGSEPQDARVAISNDGRFVAIENARRPTFSVYDLGSCSGRTCRSYDYWPFLSGKIAGLYTVRHLRFVNGGLLSFEIPPGDSAAAGTYELAPKPNIAHLTDYIGLGDSYTSGEGAFDYLAGTDTPDNTCHLSVNSYPLLLARDLFGQDGGHSVACSGAVINDVLGSGDYRGQVKHGANIAELQSVQSERLNQILTNYSPGYVPQKLFVQQYQPRVITVSVGGNDIGFGDILQKCVTPRLSRYFSDQTCYNTYESRQEVLNLVDRTVARWKDLYRQIKIASPGATVYAIGYPSVVSDTGRCPLNVALGKSELEFAEELIHYLNSSIKEAAVAASVPYVDISQALAGHRLCEATGSGVAVNGLTAGNDFGFLGIKILGRESYHPNALGHQLIEQAILRSTHNLSEGQQQQTDSTTPSIGHLLNAPKSGRPVNNLVPDNIADRFVKPGSVLQLRVNGARDSLKSKGHYIVHLDGPTGPVLGNLDAGSSGNLAGTVTLPDDITQDTHTIDVIGPGPTDRQLDITETMYVADIPISSLEYGKFNVVSGGVSRKGRKKTSESERAATHHAGQAGKNTKERQKALGISAGPSLLPEFSAATPYMVRDRGGVFWVALCVLVLALIYARLCARQIIKFFVHRLWRACNNWPKIDYKNHRRCFTIFIMRKFGVAVFSVILLASLLIFAFSTSANVAFTDKNKVLKWLDDSNLYGAFIQSAINQAEQSAGTDQSGGISLSDAAVKHAAESSFSSAALKGDVNTFLNSNYAWLNGKTAKPDFSIDLSGAKQDFAEGVGKYVATYLKSLPACTPAQSANIDPQTADPLTLDCLPEGLKPSVVSTEVTQQMADSTDFLSDPVLTANNLDPGNNGNLSQPYYQRFSALPSVYQKATRAPFVSGIVALLSLVAVILVASRKRKGLKVAAVVFALAGLLMVATKLVSDKTVHTIEQHTFNSSTVGQVQKALDVFFHHIENQLVQVNVWFGIGYLLVAGVLIVALLVTRQKGLRMPAKLQAAMPLPYSSSGDPTPEPAVSSSARPSARPNLRSSRGGVQAPKPSAAANAPRPTQQPMPRPKPRRPKPPRLVQ
jgi:lysophospholipase L1-like esterase